MHGQRGFSVTYAINGGNQPNIFATLLSYAIFCFLGRSKMPMVDMQEGATQKQTNHQFDAFDTSYLNEDLSLELICCCTIHLLDKLPKNFSNMSKPEILDNLSYAAPAIMI
jgi:hypothetical protein